MDSAEREILALVSTMSSLVHFLIAVAVLVLGLIVVRPLNKVAGVAYAGAGVGRMIGIGLSALINAMRPKGLDMNMVLAYSGITTLIWLVTALIFFGGVIFGSIKLAETRPEPQRGAW
ncbi:MAG TPA: hypothetical protein PK156_02390 [Polyangium sp.]|nr:hypothetical protein [Polyangium sp.]